MYQKQKQEVNQQKNNRNKDNSQKDALVVHQTPSKTSFQVDKRITFNVDSHYVIKTPILGQGSLGIVAQGINKNNQQKVAVKLIKDLFGNLGQAKRQLRQIKILKFLKHKNIVSLLDIMTVDNPQTYNDIYLVLEYMNCNLKQIIHGKNKLTSDMIKYILFQILDATNFMHSAGIIHRDLKPQNILASKNLQIKITDMNLARKEEENATKYVVSRPYRSPELILSTKGYTKSIDIWSIGCIFAELLGGKMLFANQSCMKQLISLVAILGKPKLQIFQDIDPQIKSHFSEMIDKMQDREKIDWKFLYQHVQDDALDLLDKMLVYDPNQRYTAEQCLNHPYLQEQRKKFPVRKCKKIFDFSFDDLPADSRIIRKAIYEQIQSFHLNDSMGEKRSRPIQLQIKTKECEQIRKQIKQQ